MHRQLSRARLIGATTLLLGLCPSSPTLAEPAPPFQVLLREALAGSPRLAESQAIVDRAAGLAVQARARPNPTASLYAENFVGSRSYADLSGQTTLQLDQPLELFGKRAARIEAGAASLAAARAQQAQGRLAFAVELAGRYAQAEAAERRVELVQEALDLADEDPRIARLLVTTGKEAELRALQAWTEVGAAQARLQSARAATFQALLSLAAYAGITAPFTSMRSGLLAKADAPAPAVDIDVNASPAYQAALADREVAARQVRVERLQPRPDPTISVGVRQIARDDFAAVAGVSLPIPVFDRNRGAVAAAHAGLRAAEARLRIVRLDLEADAKSGQARLGATDAQLAAARQAEAAAEEGYRLTRLGWTGGKLPFAEVVAARRALVEARSQTLEARLARLMAEAQLAQLAGRTPFGDQP